MRQTDSVIDDLAAFVQASPSSFHTAEEVARRLVAAGYTRVEETEAWPTGPGRCVAVRDGAVIAWVVPVGADAVTPSRIIGAHTDSTGFKLKPGGTVRQAGLAQAGVEIYGGPLLNSWLDRELALAGRVVLRSGESRLVRTGPLLRIPQLAIHLDREISKGLLLDRQRHTQPIWGTEDAGEIAEVIAAAAGCEADDIAGTDLFAVDTQAPARFGAGGVFLASTRLDNLSSVHAGLRALLGSDDADGIRVLAAYDHEEVGSETRTGAAGTFLVDVLGRIYDGLGASDAERRRAFAASWCVSSDAGHAVHPNYQDRHDPEVRPVLGGGPLLKLNANQRYTTDAAGSALWRRACAAADVATQAFVANNAIPCGSTIGPLQATRLGIRTVDVGVPLLSMHSARELAHVDDLVALGDALTAFYAGA
ncbi:M18 family aminopeptidase [Agromyces archimandritae]|uniref:M18 family aminopeptidase n=1 Tax=Agromyces archimandritae TaxID=2781962 RepID=A0A975FN39_9MICO|nr:M18 family aminopeptidase [Agromyces archimandritae]QTX04051.1 M18 family aminopeptidase [Agromyces archimandritae]